MIFFFIGRGRVFSFPDPYNKNTPCLLFSVPERHGSGGEKRGREVGGDGCIPIGIIYVKASCARQRRFSSVKFSVSSF